MHKHQETILEAIRANPNATIRQLRDVTGIKGIGQVQHHISMLTKAGLLVKGTKWVIVEKKK